MYGILSDDWQEDTIAWGSAPNLASSNNPVKTIADNFVQGAGEDAYFVGHFTATQRTGPLAIDVSEFIRQHPDNTLSFLIARELRVPGEDVDNALRSLRIASRESGDAAGPELLLAVEIPPGDSTAWSVSPTAHDGSTPTTR